MQCAIGNRGMAAEGWPSMSTVMAGASLNNLASAPSKTRSPSGVHYIANLYSLATRTNCLPTFSPWNRPMNAVGAYSRPFTMVSWYFTLPSLIHWATCC